MTKLLKQTSVRLRQTDVSSDECSATGGVGSALWLVRLLYSNNGLYCFWNIRSWHFNTSWKILVIPMPNQLERFIVLLRYCFWNNRSWHFNIFWRILVLPWPNQLEQFIALLRYCVWNNRSWRFNTFWKILVLPWPNQLERFIVLLCYWLHNKLQGVSCGESVMVAWFRVCWLESRIE